MRRFWENIILHTGTYEGSPIQLHRQLHRFSPLTKVHFEQWNQLFIDTVNELFAGKNAGVAITRAKRISKVVQEKLLAAQNSGQ